jgi:hypothetical protein
VDQPDQFPTAYNVNVTATIFAAADFSDHVVLLDADETI